MARPFDEYEIQKRKLEKLMQNIDKPIEIPTRKEEKKFPEPPQFVRNVMGSSAGAGSGEFHVYRHLRRKEMARLKYIELQAHKDELDQRYHDRLEANRRLAEERTAKKRAKRLKKKQKAKMKKRRQNNPNQNDDTRSGCDSDSDDSESENGTSGGEDSRHSTNEPSNHDQEESQDAVKEDTVQEKNQEDVKEDTVQEKPATKDEHDETR